MKDKTQDEVIGSEALRLLMLSRSYGWIERAQALADMSDAPFDAVTEGGKACAMMAAACTGLAAELRKTAIAEKTSQRLSEREQEKTDPSQGVNPCSVSQGIFDPVTGTLTPDAIRVLSRLEQEGIDLADGTINALVKMRMWVSELITALRVYTDNDECEFFDLDSDQACDTVCCRRCAAIRAINPKAEIFYPAEDNEG